jgi:lipoyl-dependent peroxiredoxin
VATERRAEVTWSGDLLSGSGTIERVGTGAFGPLAITWKDRAEEPGGNTSPEELLAAAHAACFSMALSGGLARAGHTPETLSTSATVTFVPGTGITKSVIELEAKIPGIDEAEFQEAAEAAKENCPVSQALKGNVELELRAHLTG